MLSMLLREKNSCRLIKMATLAEKGVKLVTLGQGWQPGLFARVL